MDPELSAFLCRLVDTLQEPSSELKHLAAVSGQNDIFLKLNQWSTVMQIFMKPINQEENKKLLSNVKVKMWLADVKELADDVEEILAEISKKASHHYLMAQNQTTMGKKSSLKGLIPACFTGSKTSAVMLFDDTLRSRIITASIRLEKLNTKRGALGLKMTSESLILSKFQYKGIFGREKDKKEILEMVSREEAGDHANFSVIPIIGAAGIGKTTLTRFVYDDKAVENFKPRAWVSVYEDSNVLRISKAILESITSESCNLKDLDEVLIQLKQAIFGRKFLFVLDDVSTKNHDLWETLKPSFMAAAPGSKIIVTTRNVDIEFPVDLNIQPYPLEVLSDKFCFCLFLVHANYGSITPVHEKVIDLCKGLPLAACILGGLLRLQWCEEWECVLNAKIWDLADDNQILPVLKLSYQSLSLRLQRFFTYCAILPDDYEFEEKELVLLWISEGLIEEAQEDEHMHDEQLEDIGSKLFQELLERRLFEHSSSHASKFRMHDLVKIMARWIYGETNFRLEEVLAVNEQLGRFIRASASCDGKNKLESYYDVEHLPTFPPGLIHNDDTHYITDALLSDLLPKFKRLMALSLEKQNITQLPNSFEGLRYLSYVNLSSTMIRRLPESICSLLLLQILLLRDCSHLVELPSKMRKLINLGYLDVIGVNLIREMPLGMKELECLRTLLNFIVGKGVGSDLKDLENLKFLRELYISRLHNVTGSQDTRDSILIDKKSLRVLVLEWGYQLDDTRDELMEEKVLDTLQPHNNLEKLTIKGYAGKKFSSWVGDPTYSNLVVLTLESCERCTVLPSLGCLTSLEHLTIKGMTGINIISSEIFGKDCSVPFESLETLCFEDMQEWEHWDPVVENEDVELFPRLHELSLVKCPNLRGKLPERHHRYQFFKLTIQECEQLVVSFPGFGYAVVDGREMLCGSEVDSSTSE